MSIVRINHINDYINNNWVKKCENPPPIQLVDTVKYKFHKFACVYPANKLFSYPFVLRTLLVLIDGDAYNKYKNIIQKVDVDKEQFEYIMLCLADNIKFGK